MLKAYSPRYIFRRYVLRLLNNHNGENYCLPSCNEFAKKLGIARSTVQIELKNMIADGYLVTRQGVGTFPGPKAFTISGDRIPIVAYAAGNGDIVFKSYTGIVKEKFILSEISKYRAYIQPVTFTSGNTEEIRRELNLDETALLLWSNPGQKAISLLRKFAENQKILVCGKIVPGITSCVWDLTSFGEAIAKRLLAEKRTKFLYFTTPDKTHEIWNGAVALFQRNGISLPKGNLIEYDENHATAEKKLQSGYRPDAVFFREEDGPYVIELMKRHGIDMRDACRMISATYKPRALNAPMLLAPLPIKEYGNAVTELAYRLLDGESVPESTIVNNYSVEIEEV